MFFGQDHFFEELFCICIQLVNKTWKEMRATQEDFAKVRGGARAAGCAQIGGGSGERHPTGGDVRGPAGAAGGAGADHQDPGPQAHLSGTIQDQSERAELQRDPEAAADGAAAPGGDAGCARAVSGLGGDMPSGPGRSAGAC